jgi:transcriptional regulator with XRE-family HTH domain
MNTNEHSERGAGAEEAAKDAAAADQTLGQRIRRLMQAHGLNQTELARKTGIERSELNRIINDKRQPKPQELPWLTEALGITVDSLLAGLTLPDALKKGLAELEEMARRVLAAEAERDEVLARLDALEQERNHEREQWTRERGRLHAQLQEAREEAVQRVADATRRADSAAHQLETERAAWADERTQLESAIQQLNATMAWQRLQVSSQQQLLAKERGSKVTVGVLAGLAGLLGAAALGSGRGHDDEDDN